MAGQKLAGYPMDFESKIGGRKPVAHNFCCKRELVAMGNQMVGPHRHGYIVSNLRAIGIFRLFFDELLT
jgi:hypothetical protein